jgi:hypothetical protein
LSAVVALPSVTLMVTVTPVVTVKPVVVHGANCDGPASHLQTAMPVIIPPG